MNKTITIKTKLWGTKVFENATFTKVDSMIEVYQKNEWITTISYFMLNNVISLTY